MENNYFYPTVYQSNEKPGDFLNRIKPPLSFTCLSHPSDSDIPELGGKSYTSRNGVLILYEKAHNSVRNSDLPGTNSLRPGLSICKQCLIIPKSTENTHKCTENSLKSIVN
jgi:hypothetical protein